MTCNQLIALLETHRSGEPTFSGFGTGTIEGDLLHLTKEGLIKQQKDGVTYRTTHRGEELIRALLILLP